MKTINDFIHDYFDNDKKYTTFFCPGRINLIGEHIDYNGGNVMPVAISKGITAYVQTTLDNSLQLVSTTHDFVFNGEITALPVYKKENDWANYPIAVFAQLKKKGFELSGMRIIFSSDLPEGTGLSSSAAIEVLTAFVANTLFDFKLNKKEIALLCQKAEHDFIGMKCGIMDQYAVANGEENTALLLDCEQVKHSPILFELDDYKLLVINSKKDRSLIDSAYNNRRAACEKALAILKEKNKNLTTLVQADMTELEAIQDEELKKRARHVISENLRVKLAAQALELGDIHTFGRLLDASHTSLKNDYEVSGIELDTIVDEAKKIEGCIGARMTGAGFGGCAIAIVHSTKVDVFKKILPIVYEQKIGYPCEVFSCEITAGVKQIF